MFFLPVFAADAGTVEALATARADVRSTQPLQRPDANHEIILAGDAVVSPGLRAALKSRSLSITLSYVPTLTLSDFELEPLEPQIVQNGTANLNWQDRFWRITLSESGTYSESLNTTYLYYTPATNTAGTNPQSTGNGTSPTPSNGAAPAQPAPAGGAMGSTSGSPAQNALLAHQIPGVPIQYGSEASTVTVAARIGRYTTLSFYGGYESGGGLDTRSKKTFALQYGPSAGAAVYTVASKRDTLATRLDAQETFTTGTCFLDPNRSCHEVLPIVDLQEGLHHKLTETASLDASLGVGGSKVQTQQQTKNADLLIILPVASLSFSQAFGSKGINRFALAAQVAPTADEFTGDLDNRAQVTGTLIEQVAPRVLATATVSAMRSLPRVSSKYQEPNPITLFSATLEARYLLSRLAELSVGTQDFWQTSTATGTIASEIGYIALTVHTQPLRF